MRNKRWIRRSVALMVASAAVIGVGACGSDEESAAGGSSQTAKSADGKVSVPKATVGYISVQMAAPIQQRIHEAAEAAVEHVGWDMKVVDTKGDPSAAARGVSSMVQSGVDAILMSGIEPATARPGLLQAKQKGIPVILLAAQVDDKLFDELGLKYIGQDEGKMATMLGERIDEEIGDQSEVGILFSDLILAGKLRGGGVEEAVKSAGHSAYTMQTGFTVQDGAKSAQTLLVQHPKLAALMPAFDVWTPGVVSAIKKSGKDTSLYTFYATSANVDLARENPGVIKGMVDSDVNKSAFYAVGALLEKVVGEGQGELPTDPFKYQILTEDNLPPAGQNGPVSVEEAGQDFYGEWDRRYAYEGV